MLPANTKALIVYLSFKILDEEKRQTIQGLPELGQQSPEHLHGLVHFFLRNDIRRQETQHRIVRAVDQQALADRVQHQLLAGNVQFHTEHQAEPAHLFDDPVLACELVQLDMKVPADALDRRQQLVEDVQELERDAARQDIASERASVHSGFD